MLTAGPNSSCNICLESFGPEAKAPCSIQCGHIFCATCLHRLEVSTCPLCRLPFDSRTVTRLHVDLDPAYSDPAQKYLQNYFGVASGISEAELRQLISETKAFLNTQPRDALIDLRSMHKIIIYLCDLKVLSRQLKKSLEECQAELKLSQDELKQCQDELSQCQDEINQYQDELSQSERAQAKLEKKIEDMEQRRRDEMETAMSVERSLREHCTRAHDAYLTMIKNYNDAMQKMQELQEHVNEYQRELMTHHSEEPRHSHPKRHSHSDREHRPILRDTAVSDPDTLLVSPLLEFSNRVFTYTTLSGIDPLPDVDEPISEPIVGERPHNPPTPQGGRPSPKIPDQVYLSHSHDRRPSFKGDAIPERVSGPYYRDAKEEAMALDERYHQPRRAPSRGSSRPPSRAPTRPSSPARKPSSRHQSYGGAPSPSDPNPSGGLPPILHGRQISRLHELLQGTPTPSSLPSASPSQFFPSSLPPEPQVMPPRNKQPSRSSSRSRAGSLDNLPPSKSQKIRLVNPETLTADPDPIDIHPPMYESSKHHPPVYEPPKHHQPEHHQQKGAYSASAAATALELKSERSKSGDERRNPEKEREREHGSTSGWDDGRERGPKSMDVSEKERRKTEKERAREEWEAIRTEEMEREKRRVEKEREEWQREREEYERSRGKPGSSSMPIPVPIPSSPYTSQPAAPSLFSGMLSPPPQTPSRSYGRSTGSPMLHNSHKQTTQTMPVPATTRV